MLPVVAVALLCIACLDCKARIDDPRQNKTQCKFLEFQANPDCVPAG